MYEATIQFNVEKIFSKASPYTHNSWKSRKGVLLVLSKFFSRGHLVLPENLFVLYGIFITKFSEPYHTLPPHPLCTSMSINQKERKYFFLFNFT
jgi:hypothetical protein